MNKIIKQILFLVLILIISITFVRTPLFEGFRSIPSESEAISKLTNMYNTDTGLGFRLLERCSTFYVDKQSETECIRKEIEGPHGGDETILNASVTWLNHNMVEAHFYSDIDYNKTESDVFLLLPGDMKYDCDFIQDTGFNGCGQNIPDCKGTAQQIAKEYLESCCENDVCDCHNPLSGICNFKDQNLMINTYNEIIKNIRDPNSKYKDVPIKEQQRQAYWDQGTENYNISKTQKGNPTYSKPIAVGFLFDEARKAKQGESDPLSRAVGSKILANDFSKKVKELYTCCKTDKACHQGLELPVVMIHRKPDFTIEFLSQDNKILNKATCMADSIIPSCNQETYENDCKNIVDKYSCGDKIYASGCNENNMCQFKAI